MTSDDGLCIATVESPVGLLTLAASSEGLRRLSFFPQPPSAGALLKRHPVIYQTAAELTEYFEGRRRQFSVPLDLRGTPFQKSVWDLLIKIPYGETRSYSALARQLGGVGKSRAVGLANGANPVAIIVPCHRVIGARGDLTGFGGGLEIKSWLLQLEKRNVPAAFDLFGSTRL